MMLIVGHMNARMAQTKGKKIKKNHMLKQCEIEFYLRLSLLSHIIYVLIWIAFRRQCEIEFYLRLSCLTS